jgi:hypothetical protein
VEFLAVGIRYWDKESWISYLKSSVLPLYESILAVLNLWGRLKEVAHGKLLPEIIKDMPSLELVFADTSCRAFPVYRWLLGAYIGLRKYHFLKSLGKKPRITCRMQKTEVVKYLERISVLLERVLARACELRLVTQTELQSIQEVSKRVVQEILAKPESISERFTELLSKALKITVAYNKYTRFI